MCGADYTDSQLGRKPPEKGRVGAARGGRGEGAVATGGNYGSFMQVMECKSIFKCEIVLLMWITLFADKDYKQYGCN